MAILKSSGGDENENDYEQVVLSANDAAVLKDQNKLTIFQIERWFEILKTRKKYANNLNLDDEFITEIFDLIHKYSILIQTKNMRQ